MDHRLLPLLFVVLLALSVPTGLAQDGDDSSPSMDMPQPLLEQQREWMDDAFAAANDTLEEEDLNLTERRSIEQSMDLVRELHQEGRHQAVVSNLVSLRTLEEYYEIQGEAERRNDTKGAFLDGTLPVYREGQNASEAVESRMNDAQGKIDRARGLEVLYLASSSLVQGQEQLRLYPTYQGILEAEGPTPPARLLQLSVQYSVGAKWVVQYADDLRELSTAVDDRGTGPKLNKSLVHVARAFVAQRVDQQEVPGEDSEQRQNEGLKRLKDRMNATGLEGNHVLSMGYGGVYLSTAIHNSILSQFEQGNLRQEQVRSILRQSSGNLTPLQATVDAGFYGVLQKDAHKLVDRVLESPQVGNSTLARAVARLDTARTIGQAFHPLAVQDAGTTEPGQEGPSTSDVLIAVGGGIALGAGAAVLGRRYVKG